MAQFYCGVVVLAVFFCGLWVTSQACTSGDKPAWVLAKKPSPNDPVELQINRDAFAVPDRFARGIRLDDTAAIQQNVFRAIDRDSDGSISVSEWSHADVTKMIALFCSPPHGQEKQGD